jgi:hypothetical protein
MAKNSEVSDKLFILESVEDLQDYLFKILKQARRDCYIFSRKLNPTLFNHDRIYDVLSNIARSSSQAQIKILIEDHQSLIDCKHKILHLSKRLPSKLSMQIIKMEPTNDYEFVIADKDKLWLQHAEDSLTGFANFDAKPEVKRFSLDFDELWKNSEEHPDLRQLNL